MTDATDRQLELARQLFEAKAALGAAYSTLLDAYMASSTMRGSEIRETLDILGSAT